MEHKPDLQKIWADVDWQNDTIAHLRQQVKKKIHSGVELNLVSKRIKMVNLNTPTVEDYTLYDLVLDKSYRGKGKKADIHWFGVMSLLRGLGAKPACQLIAKMPPVEKEKNELDSLNFLKNWISERELKLAFSDRYPDR